MQVEVGGVRYRLVAVPRDRGWQALALRIGGHQFGPAMAGATAEEACARLERWLEWQDAHASALAALQEAERAYHRSVAGSAFGHGADDPTRRKALDAVNQARERLDAVRLRQPG